VLGLLAEPAPLTVRALGRPGHDRGRRARRRHRGTTVRAGTATGGTEHILLALLEVEDGIGVLSGLGTDQKRAEDWVVEVFGGIRAG
jgi:hypothetical protein